jgi:dephospho-CoA kinase
LGAEIVDADVIAKEVMADGQPAFLAVRDAFPECFPDGKLDRRLLREAIFNDEKKRVLLNSLTHPVIYSVIENKLTEIEKKSAGSEYINTAGIIIDIPLYFDTDYRLKDVKVLNIECADGIRIERLKKRDNISEELARKILAAQSTNEVRRAQSDITIENNGSFEEFSKSVKQAFEECRGG